MSSESKNPRVPLFERTAQDRIGCQLQAMYADLVRQPIPEKLLATLRAFSKAEEAHERLAQEQLRRAA
jgi:hypothetical protein